MKKVLAVVVAMGAIACGGASKETKPAAAPVVNECPGRPTWTCMGGSGPCAVPEFKGQLCALGIASGLSESLGQSTAGAAARAEMSKFVEAQVETFNERLQAARTAADSAEEVQKVQAGVKELTSRKISGVATPKRFYEPSSKTTYVLATMDPEGFAKALKGLLDAAKLSDEARKKIDADAADVEASWKAAKEPAAK
jgi:hypothetical protein